MDIRDTLLLSSGSSETRKLFNNVFKDNFNILEADNNHQTMLFLKENHAYIAAVILDITISEKIDLSVLENLSDYDFAEEFPVIVIVSIHSPEETSQAFDLGATDVFFLGHDPYILQRRVQNMIELYRHKWHLEDLVEAQASTLRNSNDAIVDALSSIIEYRSLESGQHILRIRRFTNVLLDEIAHSCPEYNLTEEMIRIISSASALHDIGKISIPDAVLNKPGHLDAKEWDIMKNHTISGGHILESLHDVTNKDYLRYAYNICRYHHERWDGSGYPDGLCGDAIPICAQVVGLADAYDALTTERVYKKAFRHKKAVNMIVNGECGQFSPKLLECFKFISDKLEQIALAYADGLSPKTESFDVNLPIPLPQEGLDTLQGVQGKLQTMFHYLNSTIAEVDLNQELFHLLYNPHLELSLLNNTSSFDELSNALDTLVIPKEHSVLKELLTKKIPEFFEKGIRQMVHHFHINGPTFSEPSLYEITFLRLDFSEDSKKMFIIWKKESYFDSTSKPLLFSSNETPLSDNQSCQPEPYEFCCRNDRWLTFESTTPKLSQLLGFSKKDLQERFDNRLTNLIVPEDVQPVLNEIAGQLQQGTTVELTYRLLDSSNNIVWVSHKMELFVMTDGYEYLGGTLADITLNREIQNEQLLRLNQYQTIFAHTESIIFEWDIINQTISFSEQWKEIFGFDPVTQNILHKLSESHLHPEDVSPIFRHIHAMQSGSSYETMEGRIAKADGRYLWCRFQATALRDEEGKLVKALGIITNIDEEKRAAKALKDRAEQDALTKLINKHTARKQAEEYFNSFSQNAHCALLIIDLDNFKQINDQFGHMFGDAVLSQTAREIKKLFRSQDIVARIGGDEFMVLMRGISNRNLITARCTKLISVIQNVFQKQLSNCPISCSIGIALSPDHGTSYYEIFQRADQALYQVKSAGKNNFMFFDKQNTAFPAYKKEVTAVNERIDSDEQPGLANSNIVHYAFQRLYSAGDFDTGINDILDLIGHQMNVSRVYIFENNNDNTTCSNSYEWCNTGIEPQIEYLQNISYETDIPDYDHNFNEEGIFYCPDVTELPKQIFDILEPQGIKSMLQCAIRDNGIFRGYVGFDECSTQRLWTQDQIDTLIFFSEMLSVFLLKKRAQDEMALQANNLRNVLNNQNAFIYVIDSDTCEIQFINEKALKLVPAAQPGTLCYQSIMNNPTRCKDCPANKLGPNMTQEAIIKNQYLNMNLISEATSIDWNGRKACLVTCLDLD